MGSEPLADEAEQIEMQKVSVLLDLRGLLNISAADLIGFVNLLSVSCVELHWNMRASNRCDMSMETLLHRSLNCGSISVIFTRNFTQWKTLWFRYLIMALGIIALEMALGAEANLSWNDNSSNESGFRIERSLDGQSFSQIATVGVNTTTYADTGLQSNTTYWYRVNAYNEYGESGYTNLVNLTTEPDINEPPTISSIMDQSVKADSGLSGAIAFTVGDPETEASQLLLSASSSNESLIPTSAIQLSNSQSGSSISLSPASGQVGSSIISVYVTDGVNTVSETFQVSVEPVAVVSVTDPADGSEYYLGEAIELSPSFLGGVTPVKVSYYIDDTLVSERTQLPYSSVLQLPLTGSIQLRVVAELPGGGQLASDSLAIEVLGFKDPTDLIVSEALE